jgi:hypothetical protein
MRMNPDDNLSTASRDRLRPLLDCIAYLLAKQWLREQTSGAESLIQTTKNRGETVETGIGDDINQSRIR